MIFSMVTDIRSKFAIPVHAFELAEFVSIPVIRYKNNSNFIFLKLQNEKISTYILKQSWLLHFYQ